MPRSSQNSFEVKNYYQMDLDKLDVYLDKIRQWLLKYDGHKDTGKVDFALRVVLNAKNIERDSFTCLIIDTMT